MNGIGLKLFTFLPLFSLPALLAGVREGGEAGECWEGGQDQLQPGFDLGKWEERVKIASFSTSLGMGGGGERGLGWLGLGQECVIRSKLSACLGLTLVSPEQLKGIL